MRILRGDVQANSYYDDISDDDSVFLSLNDIQETRNVGVDGDIPLNVIDFHVDYLQDDIVLHCDGEEKDESTENGEVVRADIAESVTLSYGEGRKNSFVVCDVDNDGLISDDDLHFNNELVMHNEVYLDYGDADIEGEVNCVMDSQYAST